MHEDETKPEAGDGIVTAVEMENDIFEDKELDYEVDISVDKSGASEKIPGEAVGESAEVEESQGTTRDTSQSMVLNFAYNNEVQLYNNPVMQRMMGKFFQ